MSASLSDMVDRKFRKSDYGGAIKSLEGKLSKLRGTRFKSLLGRGFSNPPEAILAAINSFVSDSDQQFDTHAIYLEMNGFDINPDRWYFDFFGYREYVNDPEDLDWLADWQSEYYGDLIRGRFQSRGDESGG